MIIEHSTIVQSLYSFADKKPKYQDWPPYLCRLVACRSWTGFLSTLRAEVDPENYCPFCPADLKRSGREVIGEAGGWHLVGSVSPHYAFETVSLIVPAEHGKNETNLSGEDWASIGKLFAICRDRFSIAGGNFFCPFGDPHCNAEPNAHLRFFVAVPKQDVGFKMPFGKEPRDVQADYRNFQEFVDCLRRQGGAQWLFSEEALREHEYE